MKKRIAGIALTLIALMTLLTGCGSGSGKVEGRYVAYDLVDKSGAHYREMVESGVYELKTDFYSDGTGEWEMYTPWRSDLNDFEWKTGLFGNSVLVDGEKIGTFKISGGEMKMTLSFEEGTYIWMLRSKG